MQELEGYGTVRYRLDSRPSLGIGRSRSSVRRLDLQSNDLEVGRFQKKLASFLEISGW
jgi:hypothetical protein